MARKSKAKARPAKAPALDVTLRVDEARKTPEGHMEDRTRTGVRVVIVDDPTFDSLREADRGWAASRLDDGRILAVKLEARDALDDLETRIQSAKDYPETEEWASAARDLRNRLLGFLESRPDRGFVQMTVGGDGCAYIDATHGDAELRVILTRNPDCC